MSITLDSTADYSLNRLSAEGATVDLTRLDDTEALLEVSSSAIGREDAVRLLVRVGWDEKGRTRLEFCPEHVEGCARTVTHTAATPDEVAALFLLDGGRP